MSENRDAGSLRDAAIRTQLLHGLREGPRGRRTLATATGLSEMTVRLALDALHNEGLVRFDRRGVHLMPPALAPEIGLERIVRALALEMEMAPGHPIGIAAHLIPRRSVPAWRLRDLAVGQGAAALLSLRWEREGWVFSHNGERVDRRNPLDSARLDAAFPKPTAGSALVWAGGADRGEVGCGLWAAVVVLVSGTALDSLDPVR
jgi:hypothetical protein